MNIKKLIFEVHLLSVGNIIHKKKIDSTLNYITACVGLLF